MFVATRVEIFQLSSQTINMGHFGSLWLTKIEYLKQNWQME